MKRTQQLLFEGAPLRWHAPARQLSPLARRCRAPRARRYRDGSSSFACADQPWLGIAQSGGEGRRSRAAETQKPAAAQPPMMAKAPSVARSQPGGSRLNQPPAADHTAFG